MENKQLLLTSMYAAIKAGQEIMQVYASDFDVEIKGDNSPLTIADKRAHSCIVQALAQTQLPLLSEEGKEISFEERRHWKRFWLVDPLDGTKEFIKKNGEFTVNIALIEGNNPIMGVVYLPAKDILYFGEKNTGAYRLNQAVAAGISLSSLSDILEKCVRLPAQDTEKDKCRVVASRSHMSPETAAYVESLKKRFAEVELVSSGSSIKLCMVAEGRADVYPRYAPTMEWDTAAGQAVVEAAEGAVHDYETKKDMLYNRPNLRNNWFTVLRKGFE